MVVWAHGTNNHAVLSAALNNPRVMMLEGEVILKGQGTQHQELLPVMFDDSESALTFDDWLSLALPSGKGIKLHFKTIQPVELCLQKLERRKDLIKKPLHLGADILATNLADSSDYPPVDAQRFLRLTSQHFPQGTLVVGWKVDPTTVHRYTWTNVMQMYDLLQPFYSEQSISLSVHAMLSRESIPMIKWLSEMLGASITINSRKEDKVNPNDFLFLRNKFPKEMVYYDMHHSSVAEKDQESPQEIASQLQILQRSQFSTVEWRSLPAFGEEVYLTSEAVVIRKGLIIYGEDPYVYTNEPMIIKGRLKMFDVPTSAKLRKRIGITIILHEKQLPEVNSGNGIRCFIGLEGLLKLSTNLDRNNEVVSLESEKIAENPSRCLSFEIKELSGRKLVMNVQHALSCDSTSIFHPYPTSNSSVELDISDIKFKDKFIAISSSNASGYIALEAFKVN